MDVTATKFRANVYKLLDHVLETGEPVEIARKGRKLRIVPAEPVAAGKGDLGERLEPHPGAIVGDPDDLIHLDWSEAWKPYT